MRSFLDGFAVPLIAGFDPHNAVPTTHSFGTVSFYQLPEYIISQDQVHLVVHSRPAWSLTHRYGEQPRSLAISRQQSFAIASQFAMAPIEIARETTASSAQIAIGSIWHVFFFMVRILGDLESVFKVGLNFDVTLCC